MEISRERLHDLRIIEMKMVALEAAGVHNWEGYDIALKELEEKLQIEEATEKCFNTICSILTKSMHKSTTPGCYGFSEEGMEDGLKCLKAFIQCYLKI